MVASQSRRLHGSGRRSSLSRVALVSINWKVVSLRNCICRCLGAICTRRVMSAVGISIGVWAGQLGMHACPQALMS